MPKKRHSEIKGIERFKQEAPVLAKESLPDRHDHLGWLYLMQHYLAPTRLLDWTERALVALYFVVRENADDDGELWAMHPHLLNKESHIGEGLPLIDHNPVLQYLVEEIYGATDKRDLAEKIGLQIIPNRPVAFEPRRNFPRMVAQVALASEARRR